MATVKNAMELGKAIDRNDNTIEIDGKFAGQIIKIKATGNVAWLVAGGAITVAIVAILAMSPTVATGPIAGAGLVAESVALGAGGAGAVGILGVSTTVTAISIGVGAKSRSAVNKLRNNYDMKKSGNKLILTRKR
ncbi:MAG: hypothetical protein HDR09_13710 [Lachnospiraceae bacterium]|nr:hypothetical protein [Lachnospiraceae bacterium]